MSEVLLRWVVVVVVVVSVVVVVVLGGGGARDICFAKFELDLELPWMVW